MSTPRPPSRKVTVVNSLALALVVAIAACGGDRGSPFAALFEPSAATPGAGLHGVWGGSIGPLEVRLELRPDRFTFANRCGGRVVGVSVAAAIDDGKLEVRETKQAGDKKCHADATAGSLPPCARAQGGEACFGHDGLRLVLHNGDAQLELTKVRD